MHNPKVSILIPVWNRENIIKETLDSAINQTYRNIEIIVVDNKSTDGTWDILKQYAKKDKRIKIFQNETNIGPVRNWKRCIDEAKGKYGKILWSDDLIAPEFLEKTVPFLENDEDIGFVFTGTEIFGDNFQRKECYFIGESGIYDSEKYIHGVLFEGNYPVSPGCALFRLDDLRKNLLIEVPNKVNSNFAMHAIGNDLLIFLLTANQYRKFVFVNEKLSFFRAHEGSISIQSNNGKLPLHYNLVKAFFVEKYRPNLVRKLNTNILLTIMKYPKTAKQFNLNRIKNYYLDNQEYSIKYKFLIKKILYKIANKIKVNK